MPISVCVLPGTGSSRDWQVCCMSLFCLPVVFAQNMRRALLLDYWRQGIACMLCWGLNWSVQLLALGACGDYPELELGDAVSATSSDFQLQAYDAEVAKYMRCARGWQPVLILMHLLCWTFLLYAGYRRIQMRRRFGLPGDDLRDYLSWLCCAPCSVAQETRTLAANQVAQGVWHGAGAPQATQVTAPHPQVFMPAHFPSGGMVFYQGRSGQMMAMQAPLGGGMPGQVLAFPAAAMPQGMQHMMAQQQQQHDGFLFDDSDLLLRPGTGAPAYGHPTVPPPPPPPPQQQHGSLL
jgi:Cys-rich protein (TIGR01571 family)